MGILNVTPDSFSDGGLHAEPGPAVEAGIRMQEEGAAWLDVGGESTRPGASPVPADVQMKRVVPVISKLARRLRIPISIDTSEPAVARAALDAGASIVNDVQGFRDPAMRKAAAARAASVVVMHMQGKPASMQVAPSYRDPVEEIVDFLSRQARLLGEAGLPRERVFLDPGIGFGKALAHNLEILRRIREFSALGHPLVVGTSRKSFLGALTGREAGERLPATLGSVAWLAMAEVEIVRVHDVKAAVDCLRVIDAIAGRAPARKAATA